MNNSVNHNSNELYHAAKEGDLEKIKVILEEMEESCIDKCLNSSLSTGSTPLIIAARYGKIEVVKYLVIF